MRGDKEKDETFFAERTTARKKFKMQTKSLI